MFLRKYDRQPNPNLYWKRQANCTVLNPAQVRRWLEDNRVRGYAQSEPPHGNTKICASELTGANLRSQIKAVLARDRC